MADSTASPASNFSTIHNTALSVASNAVWGCVFGDSAAAAGEAPGTEAAAVADVGDATALLAADCLTIDA